MRAGRVYRAYVSVIHTLSSAAFVASAGVERAECLGNSYPSTLGYAAHPGWAHAWCGSHRARACYGTVAARQRATRAHIATSTMPHCLGGRYWCLLCWENMGSDCTGAYY